MVTARSEGGSGVFWLAETKGEVRSNVPLKNETAELWYKKTSATKYGQWRYLFAQQVKLESALECGAETFAELQSILM